MPTEQENRNKVDAELTALAKTLGPIVTNTPGFENESPGDLSNSIRVILDNWDTTFKDDMTKCQVTWAFIDEVRYIRNDFSHGDSRYESSELTRSDVATVQDLRLALNYFRSSGQAPQTSIVQAPKNLPARQVSTRRAHQSTSKPRQTHVRPTVPDDGYSDPEEETEGLPYPLLAVIFVATLIFATFLADKILPTNVSGVAGFITAVAVTAYAFKARG